MAQKFWKDVDAILDFAFDWSYWLNSDIAESITNYTITVESGITKDSDSESGGVVTVWLSGGTAGQTYTVACKVVTSLNRTDERTFTVYVKNR